MESGKSALQILALSKSAVWRRLTALSARQQALLLIFAAWVFRSSKAHLKVEGFLSSFVAALRLRIEQLLRPVRKDFLVEAPPTAGHAQVFTAFGDAVPQWLQQSLEREGFRELKPIQKAVLPLALGGKDVVATAPTGSGKTLAFLVPAFVHAQGQVPLKRLVDGPIALILTPTRELATQIGGVAYALKGHMETACLYGGVRRQDQLQKLRYLRRPCELMVATPGRLIDFVRNFRAFSLRRVSFFVLDEGDRMLEDGFEEDVLLISSEVRRDRQMLFFSATWPPMVEEAAGRLCCRGAKPEHVSVDSPQARYHHQHDSSSGGSLGADGHHGGADGGTGAAPAGISWPPPEIRQVIEVISPEMPFDEKVSKLLKHLEEPLGEGGASTSWSGKALIFVKTRRMAEILGATVADSLGLDRCGVMHGQKAQDQREATLRAFRSNRIQALVSTDVLGRGLDIPNVTHVVVFDFPDDIETYIHRVGRTGRNGHYGKSIAFFEHRWWQPDLATELMTVLRACKQNVPQALLSGSADGGEPQVKDGPPDLDAESPPLATDAELGDEWAQSGARVWDYSANGGKSWAGKLELRSGGKLRTTWGWGEWWLTSPRGDASSSTEGNGAAVSEPNDSQGTAATLGSPVPLLAVSWNGVTDIVALSDKDGCNFHLIARNGRPPRPDRPLTLGRACVGATSL